MSAKDRELEQQDRLRARLWGAREQPRNEGGWFAPRPLDDTADSGPGPREPGPGQRPGFDGGARGPAPEQRTVRQEQADAIRTLDKHRGNEIADHAENLRRSGSDDGVLRW